MLLICILYIISDESDSYPLFAEEVITDINEIRYETSQRLGTITAVLLFTRN